MASGLERRVAGRSVAFYAANLASVLLPLVSVPYLTRVLGPQAWGALAIGQAVATTMAVLVDYGHAQSGTRALLQAGSPTLRANVAGTILASKVVLALATLVALAGLGATGILPIGGDLLLAAAAAGVGIGFAPLWLVQAGDRIGRFLAFDVAVKAVATAGILFLVHEPSEAARVIWLQAIAGAVSFLGGLLLAGVPLRGARPSTRGVARALYEQRHGFLFRAAILTYTTANVLVLGVVAPPEEVGLFAAADRLTRLIACFAGPLGQALYPVLARSWQEDPTAAARLAYRVTLGVTGIGVAAGLGLFFTADVIAPLVLGAEFSAAASVLRVLAPLPALICVSNILGIQWMFSIGEEGAFVRILALAGLVCLPTGALLGAVSGAVGMASAATLAEVVVTGGVLVHLARKRSLPGKRMIGSRAHAH